MAISLNNNLLDVTKQSTEKIVIQDWLDGNNFSQTSSGFEPLVVHADVHFSAAGVSLGKRSQSDIDEDFVSVSQILPRKKLNNPIKKKSNTNLSNLDAIETYEECKAKESSSGENNTFDKLFHNGKNLAQVIKKTYPGKVKSKMKNTKTALRGVFTDLFLNNFSQNTSVNNNSIKRDRHESSKLNWSSGSGEVWSPKKYKTKEKLLSSQTIMSRKICKKYFKKHSQHINEQKLNSKRKTKNKKLLSDKQIKSPKLKNKSNSAKASKNDTLYIVSTNTENNKDSLVNDENEGSFSKFDKINDSKDVITSSVTPLNKTNIYKYKSRNMSVKEYENIINKNPIVLTKRLDILKFQTTKQQKSTVKEINLSNESVKTDVDILKKSNISLNNINNCENHVLSTNENFVIPKDVGLDNFQSSDTKETVEVKQIINRKLNKIVKLQSIKKDSKDIETSKTLPLLKNLTITVDTNLNKCTETSTFFNKTSTDNINNVESKLLSLRKDNTEVKEALHSHPIVGNKLSNCKETLISSQKEPEQLLNTETNIISNHKINLKIQDPQRKYCESSRENCFIQKDINFKLNNKRTLTRKVKITKKNTSTTCHQDCSSLIKECSGELIKRIPIVLIKPLKMYDNKTQIIKDEGTTKRTKLNVRKGSTYERNNKVCTNSFGKQCITSDNNLNLTVCKSKQEKKLLVTPIKVSDQKSPGWSRLERTKKDFNTSQKNRLNISIGNKLLRSVTKLEKSSSSCQDELNEKTTETSPEIKSKKIFKHLFEKGKRKQILNINTNNSVNKFDLQQKVNEFINDFNSPETNNEALQYKIQAKNKTKSKRKYSDVISDSIVHKKVQSLESNSKRRKFASAVGNVEYLTPAHIDKSKSTGLQTPKEQTILKSTSTMTANSLTNVGVQTCSDIYLTYCLSLMQNSWQNKGNKLAMKCIYPEAVDSEPLFHDSNTLTPTVEVSDIASDKTKDSDFILPSCKYIPTLQNRNAPSYFIGNNCTDETYLEVVENIKNVSNNKEIGTNLGNTNNTEKEHPIVSQDLFSNSFNERLDNSNSCLNNSRKPNIFCDRIPFKELNSVGRLSFDFSQNKCLESILNDKKEPYSVQTDNISFTFRNKTEKCNELSRLDMNQKKFDNLDANEMNEIETVEELYFLCSSSSASPVNNDYENTSRAIDTDIESPLQSTDFINGTPEALNVQNNINFVPNVARSTQTSDSPCDNESMMSLSTVKFHELSSLSSEKDLNYDFVVSSLGTETCNSKKTNSLESALCKDNLRDICAIKEMERKSDDFLRNTSESIQQMDELTNEVCDSIKESSWNQENQILPATNLTQFTNTINTSLLTEVLDTQQQKHLGEECIQLEAQIKAMQEELSRNMKH